MGVALERLKAFHKHIPPGDADALLTWAHKWRKVYTEYIKAWQPGFESAVVKLAPADRDFARWEGGLGLNEDGDIMNAEGERFFDVVFLLYRPFVRVLSLASIVKDIEVLKPSSGQAAALAEAFADLANFALFRTQAASGLRDVPTTGLFSTKQGPLASLSEDEAAAQEAKQRPKPSGYSVWYSYHDANPSLESDFGEDPLAHVYGGARTSSLIIGCRVLERIAPSTTGKMQMIARDKMTSSMQGMTKGRRSGEMQPRRQRLTSLTRSTRATSGSSCDLGEEVSAHLVEENTLRSAKKRFPWAPA